MRTAAEALEQHGFSGEALLNLSRKVASDALKRHGAWLDDQRFDELADYLLEVGVRYAARYEPGHDIGISTFLYRRMRIRYTDWLRLTMGDKRNRRQNRIPPTSLFPFDEAFDGASWDGELEAVEERLSAEWASV